MADARGTFTFSGDTNADGVLKPITQTETTAWTKTTASFVIRPGAEVATWTGVKVEVDGTEYNFNAEPLEEGRCYPLNRGEPVKFGLRSKFVIHGRRSAKKAIHVKVDAKYPKDC